MRGRSLAAGLMSLCLYAAPALGQITVLDSAQDGGGLIESGVPALSNEASQADTPPPICGTQDLTIARMSWSSAALLAEIHARVLAEAFGCTVRVVPGDLAATTSSMGSTGQPAIAPEMWVTRVADVWNAAIQSQMVRSAAPSFAEATMEGWFAPSYLNGAFAGSVPVAELAASLAEGEGTEPVRFISCPADWACAVINRHLIEAHGLGGVTELVEPANRFEMDALIAEAVSRRETFFFYYWQPNAVLAQVEFRALDMGEYKEEAMACLARIECASPQPSAFPSEMVVGALAEWVFAEAPAIAGYFQRVSFPLSEMNTLLAQLNEPEASVESVAERFVANRRDLWEPWTGGAP
ncbi:glycine betaine/proline transport system substrate-binding protein [Devosia crocina]|uniref:Glycine betaine/proline transport system substrate-binding protein n=1 Tax=Devosia crocina TaxID=429728 RepID=A0A1I7NR93_9HYPH|nr:glycine betaine ABC transporter substrate-binding protein [Devosia crocina]SFV37120.1 glycine betaine/proline transport system substrate-binding protein [Devosia crocina]